MTDERRLLEHRIERLVHEFPALVSELRLDSVLDRVAGLSAELIGARYAAIGLLGPDRRSLVSFTVSGLTEEEQHRIGPRPVGRGILGLLIREGQPVRLADLAAHPDSAGFPAHHPAMHSFLGVPIASREGVIGELYLTEKIGGGEFTLEDEHLAGLLAIATATAVENARLHTDRTVLLEEVQQLHRSRERFFAMVNHELRNSLAAVYGWAEILVRKKDRTEVPRAAYEILDSADQAVSLISDLLDLSRLDEDRLKPVMRDIECGSVVRGAVQRVIPSAEERHIRLVTEPPGTGVLCRTDSHRVEQILVNVLRNAIRHTAEGSEVRVGVHPGNGVVVITVDDQGPGIKPEDAEHIFDVYFTQAGEERIGHGLGLPLSRRLAQLLGGDLTGANRESGGATFTLTLPAASPLS
ncbi:MAG TPA: GAF domain-containing sensor histidine kinase [Gemmatimonadales bacterium]